MCGSVTISMSGLVRRRSIMPGVYTERVGGVGGEGIDLIVRRSRIALVPTLAHLAPGSSVASNVEFTSKIVERNGGQRRPIRRQPSILATARYTRQSPSRVQRWPS